MMNPLPKYKLRARHIPGSPESAEYGAYHGSPRNLPCPIVDDETHQPSKTRASLTVASAALWPVPAEGPVPAMNRGGRG